MRPDTIRASAASQHRAGAPSGLSPYGSQAKPLIADAVVQAARALLRADDLHIDNRAEKAALRTALAGLGDRNG